MGVVIVGGNECDAVNGRCLQKSWKESWNSVGEISLKQRGSG